MVVQRLRSLSPSNVFSNCVNLRRDREDKMRCGCLHLHHRWSILIDLLEIGFCFFIDAIHGTRQLTHLTLLYNLVFFNDPPDYPFYITRAEPGRKILYNDRQTPLKFFAPMKKKKLGPPLPKRLTQFKTRGNSDPN
ncbi:hypothetical protein Hdeb2414_s0009g00311791 [Helianthus debilis subsp. tardiflorus]